MDEMSNNTILGDHFYNKVVGHGTLAESDPNGGNHAERRISIPFDDIHFKNVPKIK